MTFTPDLAEIRFGCGLSPAVAPPGSAAEMLDGLTAPDLMADRFPIPGFDTILARLVDNAELRKQRKAAKGTAREAELTKAARRKVQEARREAVRWYGATVQRWTWTGQGLRERLALFWADHFTAIGKNAILSTGVSPYVEDAIRPHMAGNFADLLIAAATHPLMLHFLDQVQSIGPDSRAGRKLARAGKARGLNENLAREVLELHTLGVGGPYSQDDVRQLAELFTGLSFRPDGGFAFRPELAEPGAETVLGRGYGGDPATVEAIHDALRDIAAHPVTAQHVAWKLAVHFVADRPDPALVDHVAARFRDSGGHLAEVYAALLEHPAAWTAELTNVKPPADFIASTARALAVAPDRFDGQNLRLVRRGLIWPMAVMGQPWQKPAGPDGWPEEDETWITPQGLAARMRWAMAAPALLQPDLPDPRAFATDTLGSYADARVRFAAEAAETRPEAIGLVLSAPAFQRR